MTRDEMLAITGSLDVKAKALLATGVDDVGLFVGMAYDMPEFKRLLDGQYSLDMEASAGRFPSFHHYASVLSDLAGCIANGSIEVPR